MACNPWSGPLAPVVFRVPDDYDIHEVIGKGAYGIVCSATHKPTGQKVAIKKAAPFGNRLACIRTLREIKLLQHFQHENIVQILDVLRPVSLDNFKEVYLVQELMPTDLCRVIQTQQLSDAHCQYFIYQLLRGLKAIHSAGVLHRDLKPANLLVNSVCDLKICDFGLARADKKGEDGHGLMTEYVATRWYRAPEIMLTFRQYTSAVDLWSAGCILAEMLGRQILFAGKHYHHQLILIFGILGSPTAADIEAIRSHGAREYIKSIPKEERTPWRKVLPEASDHALDLIDRLLTFNPERRITAEEALKHAYVELYHDPDDEPTSVLVSDDAFSFDRGEQNMDKHSLKRLIFAEIMQNRNPIPVAGAH